MIHVRRNHVRLAEAIETVQNRELKTTKEVIFQRYMNHLDPH